MLLLPQIVLLLQFMMMTPEACHRRLDMGSLLADKPKVHRRESSSPYYHHTTPKTVILVEEAHHPVVVPFGGGQLPALLPIKHFGKHLKHHAHAFIRHRTKKLHKLFRHLLGDDHQNYPVKILPAGAPVKFEGYVHSPPQKIVHVHSPPTKVVKLVESYGPKVTHPTKIVKYIEEHLHREPSPTPVVLDKPVPTTTKIVRYVETIGSDGSKTVRVVGNHNPFPPPPPPQPPLVGPTKTRITILQSDDDREPPIVYRDRVPATQPYSGLTGPSTPIPPPPPLPLQPVRPEPVIYSRGALGAAPQPAHPPPQLLPAGLVHQPPPVIQQQQQQQGPPVPTPTPFPNLPPPQQPIFPTPTPQQPLQVAQYPFPQSNNDQPIPFLQQQQQQPHFFPHNQHTPTQFGPYPSTGIYGNLPFQGSNFY